MAVVLEIMMHALYLGQVTSEQQLVLVVDTNLEGGWAPVNELDGTLRFDGRMEALHPLESHHGTSKRTPCIYRGVGHT